MPKTLTELTARVAELEHYIEQMENSTWAQYHAPTIDRVKKRIAEIDYEISARLGDPSDGKLFVRVFDKDSAPVVGVALTIDGAAKSSPTGIGTLETKVTGKYGTVMFVGLADAEHGIDVSVQFEDKWYTQGVTVSKRSPPIVAKFLTEFTLELDTVKRSISEEAAEEIRQDRTVFQYEFDKDKDGNFILTDKFIYSIAQSTYDKKLKKWSRWEGPFDVAGLMGKLDTWFYSVSQDEDHKYKLFIYNGKTYTAEQVNYLGVGLGFKHFHLFSSEGEGHTWADLWNLMGSRKREGGEIKMKWPHPATPGEHEWTSVGYELYSGLNH